MSGFEKTKGLGLAKESPPIDEQVHIDSLIHQLKEKMEIDYGDGRTLRDAHPKMHGCVKAEFVIETNLPEEFRIGVFKQARSYKVWVRFSNQGGTPSPDWNKDIRGVAIKLMGVEGEKLLDDEKQGSTQDFILISTDAFVTKDVAEFDGLIKATIGGTLKLGWFFFNPFNSHLRVFRNLMRALKRFSNPFEIEYFSVAPYLLGSQAVKYALKPTVAVTSDLPKKPSENYLREAMVKQLNAGDASFDFMVQVQTDPVKMPIEDPGVAWDEALSPFRKVATLIIPCQTFDSPEQREFGDNLSFNPWRCLPEHRPLGGISRARKQVYQTLSEFRHKRNDAPLREPTENEKV